LRIRGLSEARGLFEAGFLSAFRLFCSLSRLCRVYSILSEKLQESYNQNLIEKAKKKQLRSNDLKSRGLGVSEKGGEKERFRAILLFGAPGAGKGTQAKFLAQAGGHVHVSSGELFRGLSADSSEGRLFLSYAEKGHLVPDEATVKIWYDFVLGLIATHRFHPKKQFLILDGIPRTALQAELLSEYVDVERLIVLEARDLEVFVGRLKKRALIEKRFDDADEKVLQKRMQVYERETASLLRLFPRERIVRVDATEAPIQVLRDILIAVADHLVVS